MRAVHPWLESAIDRAAVRAQTSKQSLIDSIPLRLIVLGFALFPLLYLYSKSIAISPLFLFFFLKVQSFIRHGARTPYTKPQCWAGYDFIWNCNVTEVGFYCWALNASQR